MKVSTLAFWRRQPVPVTVPTALAEIVAQMKAAGSQEEALRVAHRCLSGRYHGQRGQTYWQLGRLFRDRDSILASPPGFLHCNQMNYVFMVVLVRSGWFSEADIRLRWTLVFGISPHQYVEVKVGKRWVAVDVWGASYGMPLGDHAHWFHVGRLW